MGPQGVEGGDISHGSPHQKRSCLVACRRCHICNSSEYAVTHVMTAAATQSVAVTHGAGRNAPLAAAR